MKIAWKLITAITLIVVAVSCTQQVEPTPKFAASAGEFAVTTSAATVTATAKDSTAAALTVSWSDPKFSVGLKKSKFTVMVGKSGGNFSSFTTKEFLNATTGTLTGKEMNGMALKFGGVVGQPIALDLMVIASHENNNEPKRSNVVPVSVTAFSGFALTPSAPSFSPSPATPSATGVTFSWNNGFSGFNGVTTYQLQHAKAGTSFATPTSADVAGFSKSFTHLELNSIALGYGVAPSIAGNVEFRVKATNELGAITYSSVATVAITPYIAINSVGIIGAATPGGWGTDTDLYRPDASKPSEWEVNIYLTGGQNLLFIEDDKFDTKWGVGGKGGGDIPIANSGYYKAKLNVATGAYSFTPIIVPSIPNGLSLTGDGIGGWGVDTNLTQSATDANIYTGTVSLTLGSVKFRHTGDWGISWGGSGTDNAPQNFPSSWGTNNNGGNIKINTAGSYFVWINTATGEYAFGPTNRSTPFTDIGIIGDSTPAGWSNDTNLMQNPANPFKWSKKLTLVAGAAKFRADNDWAANWGDAPFPSGIGTQGGSDIKNVTAGTYQIIFNTLTGEYTFTK
jgi:SusE outer membrane protein